MIAVNLTGQQRMLGAVDVLAAIDLGKGNVARDSGLTSWLGYALPCLQVIPRGNSSGSSPSSCSLSDSSLPST
ncbi:MAG: hypothetical protein FRX49_01689 [Trebouxia sp. A1-2]|nr:MAG: hypothetical protein FRX49_01689 [Trebouxia sp. A1-2]